MNEIPIPRDPVHQLQFIELDAPEFLAEGQNFYDQPPFSQMLEAVAVHTGTSLEKLRHIVTTVGRSQHWATSFRGENDGFQEVNRKMQLLDPNSKQHVREWRWLNREELPQYEEAVRAMGRAISEYPYWWEYVNTANTRETYDWEGNFSLRGKWPYIPVRTYASWVTQRLKAEGNARLLGIETIFPQDFAGETPALPTFQGPKRPTRSWRILKTSELIREKR